MARLILGLSLLLSPLPALAQAVQPHNNAGGGIFVPWPPPDAPPAPIDLQIDTIDAPPTDSTITLTWVAPSDNPGGIIIDIAIGADQYDLRYSTTGVIDDVNWDGASPCEVMTPAVPGEEEVLTITGLTPGTQYWFAIKSRGSSTQLWSDISNSPEAKTTGSVPPPPSPTPTPSPVNNGGGNGGGGDGGGCGGSAGSICGLTLAGLISLLLIRR